MRACGVMPVPAATVPGFDTGAGGAHSFAAGAFGAAGAGHGGRAAAPRRGGPEARWWAGKERAATAFSGASLGEAPARRPCGL